MKLLILFYCIYIAKAIGVTLPWWAYSISAAVFAAAVYGEIIDKGGKNMSGGSLNYFYCQLQDHTNDFGDKELNELVADLAELFHDREWYLSADTGEGDWNEARDAFKDKWFTEHGRQERIEKYLDAFAEEVRQTFGMSRRFCKNCKHWGGREKPFYDGKYGNCPFHNRCLMQRSESCEKFEEKDNEP